MAIKGTILILAVLLSISTYVSSQNIECYNCGYREDASGKRTKIPMEYIDVPFCCEDNLSNSTAPHEPTFPVCNSSPNQWNEDSLNCKYMYHWHHFKNLWLFS